MAEKVEFEHADPQKGDDILGGEQELTPAEDKRLLRRIDMW